MAELWSDYTDNIITELDAVAGAKYGKANIRRFLSNPAKYASQANINATMQKMRNDANAYFDGRLGDLSAESKTLSDNLIKADSITGQIAQNISMQAKQNKVPIIKPPLIERDVTKDQTIYVDAVDGNVMTLIEKLVTNAMYIADNTGTFDNKKVGEWVFGGKRTYVLRVYVPQTNVVLLRGSRDELNALFDVAADYIKQQK